MILIIENTILWKDKNNNILPFNPELPDSFLIQENLVNIITKCLIFDENKEKTYNFKTLSN